MDAKFNDPAFKQFVDEVSPRTVRGIQPVFIAEFFTILQILWEIYQILKKLGVFSAWFQKRQVRLALKKASITEKEIALKKIRDGLSPVPVLARFLVLSFALLAPVSQAADGIFSSTMGDVVVQGRERFHTGYKRNLRQLERMQFRSFPEWQGKGDPIPAEFNWADKCGKLAVENQGGCGSCWWFGTKGAFSDHIQCSDHKNGQDLISGQWGIDCSGGGSCGGGNVIFDAFMSPRGAVWTSEYGPYRARNSRCDKSKVVYHEQGITTGRVTAPGGGRARVEDIQRAIMETGTVAICGAARSLASGGWVEIINGQTNHCYRTPGWKEGSLHGKKAGVYWDVINNWLKSDGSLWGDEGHAYVRASNDGVSLAGSVITEAFYITYKPVCEPQPVADAGPEQSILNAVGHPDHTQIGTPALKDMSYSWSPAASLSDPTDAQPLARPKKTTVYTVKVTSPCGTSEAKVTVRVFNKVLKSDGVYVMKEIK
jgi:hypothetical protein